MGVELTDLERKSAANDEVNWVTASFMAIFHVGAIAALVAAILPQAPGFGYRLDSTAV